MSSGDVYICGAYLIDAVTGAAGGYVARFDSGGTLLGQVLGTTASDPLTSDDNMLLGPTGGYIQSGLCYITDFGNWAWNNGYIFLGVPTGGAIFTIPTDFTGTQTDISTTLTSWYDVGASLSYMACPESCQVHAGSLWAGCALTVDGGGGGLVEIDMTSGAILDHWSDGSYPTTPVGPAPDQKGVDWICFAPNSDTMFYTSEGTHILAWNVATQRQAPNVVAISDASVLYATHVAGSNLVSAGSDVNGNGIAWIVDPASGVIVNQWPLGADFSNNNTYAMSVDATGVYAYFLTLSSTTAADNYNTLHVWRLTIASGAMDLWASYTNPGDHAIGPNAQITGGGFVQQPFVTTIPPIRQYPRDDNLALGAPRQRSLRNGPTSFQNSYRQYPRGSYA